MQDNGLHSSLLDSFNYLGYLGSKGKQHEAHELITRISECDETGLGFSATRKGSRISKQTAEGICRLFQDIPQLRQNGFSHIEEIQLLVEKIAKDRISDIACSLLKSFLIDYTIDQCNKYGIPREEILIENVFDLKKKRLTQERVSLPVNPAANDPILLLPKRWLRKAPWISSDNYIKDYYMVEILEKNETVPEKGEILSFNRKNYDLVSAYIKTRERTQASCSIDPLFQPIPIVSAKKKLSIITQLPTGKTENADRKYEDGVCQLLASLLYPYLDFATEQSRTVSGTHIRDLIFYNTRSNDFLENIYLEYKSKQIVFELKNVKEVTSEHINQLHRYLKDQFGNFGVIVTRNRPPKKILKNTIDLWSGQRVCIVFITDVELDLMVNVFESKQRDPIEVLNKAFIQFTRDCPG